jgi:3-phenylpropionate/trans-cinnamate dioxygenase ferredoxin subunit
MPAVWTKAAALADLPATGVKIVNVDGLMIALCRAGDTLWAVEDRCSHDDGPLGEGELDGFEIMCPRHGAKFDVRTGAVTRMPAAVPVRAFKVKVEGDSVLVDLG